jgi:hypothetical protein
MRYAIFTLVLALAAPLAGGASAAPLHGKAAAKQLYAPQGAQVQVLKVKGLTAKDARILQQVGATQKYYGAIAFSPGDGLVDAATVAAANYHSIDAAERSALKACDARRSAKAPCVIAARIEPKGYRPGRALGLSSEATEIFDKVYLKQHDPKAMAISRATGLYGVAQGRNAESRALETCRAKAEKGAKSAKTPGDCTIVIAD